MSTKLQRARTADWDAKAYQQFSRLRQRPVNELLDRVDLENPKRI
jgi:trans-aconitate 2-methyltransferase